jgi:undecaprenyl-diphosphatase
MHRAQNPQPRHIVRFSLFLLPFLLFLTLAYGVSDTSSNNGDEAILNLLHSVSNTMLDSLMVLITHTAAPPVIAVGTLLAALHLLYRKRAHHAAFLLFAVIGSTLLNVFSKLVFQRDRPALWEQIINEASYSFPSGHAMLSSTLALTVIVLCWRTKYRQVVLIAGVAYALAVGLSRVYLGVHYPSDILAGWCISALWVGGLYYAFTYAGRLRKSRSNK